MEAKSLQALAVIRASYGDFRKALGDFYAVREEETKKYGDDPQAHLLNKNEIQIASVLYLQGEFDEAFDLYTKTLKKIELYPEEYVSEIFEAKCFLAALYSRKMKNNSAREMYDELREFIEKSPVECSRKMELKRDLAMSLKEGGELERALEIFKEVHQFRLTTNGEADRNTQYSHSEVAIVLLEQGKYRQALSILEEVDRHFPESIFGDISFLRLKRYLADVHMCLGLIKIAEDLYFTLLNAVKDRYPFHPEVLVAIHNWGRSLAAMNEHDKALCVFKEVHNIRVEQAPNHPDTARIALDIATIHANKKEYADALINFVDVPAPISSTFKWNPDLLLNSTSFIASILDASQEVSLKKRLITEYSYLFINRYKLRELPYHHKDILQRRTLKGEVLIYLEKPDIAVEILEDVLKKRNLVLKNDYTDCIDLMKHLANAYNIMKRYVEAFGYYSEIYEIQKLITGDNSMESVKWEAKIREITNVKEKTVLIDTVVSEYKRNIKVNVDSENDSMEGNFPLHVASETGRIAMVKFLLFKGAKYNEENSEKKTPENIACNNALKSFFKLLDSLFIAVKNVDHESVNKVLDIMNDTRLRDDAVKGFPVLLTGLDRIRDIVDKTILNTRDNETGSTLLHLACRNGDLETVKRLLDLEVDRTLTDNSNQSPRDVAAEKGVGEVLQLLDSYSSQQSQDLDDSTITQRNPEMPEDIMDQES